ncbi:hypothetical protein HDN1F_16930 [gamma proteobacterium HdN1]|nr:hypothetical protein HDN1F_16930 [gamma proteobacterium HdN1]
MNVKLATRFGLSALALAITPAHAVDLRFDGFATFVVGQMLDDDELNHDPQGNLMTFRGFDDQINFQSNNVFAIQARADLGEGLSATAQIMAKGVDDYDAKFSWAYLSYELTPEWTISAGQMRIPYFYYSESLDVGYSYPFIRPPFNTYDIGGFDNISGLKAEWQTDVGNWVSRVTMLAGRTDTTLKISQLPDPVKAQVSRMGLLAWSMNYDAFTVRGIYARANLSLGVSDYLDAIGFDRISNEVDSTLTGIGLPALGLNFSNDARHGAYYDNDAAEFYGIAFNYDPGPYFVTIESTVLDLQNGFMQNPGTGTYLNAGVRLGKITPYFTIERAESDYNEKGYRRLMAEVNHAGLQAQYGSLVGDLIYSGVGAGLKQVFVSSLKEENAYNIGVRYDFHPSAAFKLEYMTAKNHNYDLSPQAIAASVDVIF